jgi:hypothetical protein
MVRQAHRREGDRGPPFLFDGGPEPEMCWLISLVTYLSLLVMRSRLFWPLGMSVQLVRRQLEEMVDVD